MSRERLINFLRSKGIEPTHRDIEVMEDIAKSINDQIADETMWNESARRIAEIDKLEDKYGYLANADERTLMPNNIRQRLEFLHEQQSKFEAEYA